MLTLAASSAFNKNVFLRLARLEFHDTFIVICLIIRATYGVVLRFTIHCTICNQKIKIKSIKN